MQFIAQILISLSACDGVRRVEKERSALPYAFSFPFLGSFPPEF